MSLDKNLRLLLIVVGGVTVTGMFLAFLLAAVAQQQVAASLKAIDKDISYSEADDLMSQSAAITETIAKLEKDLARTNAMVAGLDRTIKAETANAERFRTGMQAAVSEATLTKWCPAFFPKTGAMSAADVANAIGKCRTSGVDTRTLPQYAAIVGDYSAMVTAQKKAARAERNRVTAAAQAKVDEAALAEFRALDVKAKRVRPAFLAKERLKELVGISWIFDVPPIVMPIFLTFFSGMFGALLIHLILICYPENNYDFRRSADISQYVLLGGLIATAIYVALGAGASMLGFSDAGTYQPDNYLSFGAIGLFAGMFSNRAADWLSDQSKLIMHGPGKGGAPAPTAAPTPTPAPATMPAEGGAGSEEEGAGAEATTPADNAPSGEQEESGDPDPGKAR
jgi:hypothetical protein